MGKFKSLPDIAKIRLAVFTLIILWGAFLTVRYAYEIYAIRFGDRFIDTGGINDVGVGSLDLTGFVQGIASGINVGVSFIMTVVYSVIILLLTMIPMYIFQIIALKKDTETYPEEAEIGNRVMLGAFIIVMILGLIITECVVILPLLAFSLMWYASGFLLYIIQIKGQTL